MFNVSNSINYLFNQNCLLYDDDGIIQHNSSFSYILDRICYPVLLFILGRVVLTMCQLALTSGILQVLISLIRVN